MKITFLGTGTSQGVPVIACPCDVCHSADPKDKRLRSSVLIEEKGFVMAVDAGPDFRQQMLRENVLRLDAILFTHSHKDHLAGLDDVRAFNYFQGMPVDTYATAEVHAAIKHEFHYAFDTNNTYPWLPKVRLHEISNEPFALGPFQVVPVEVSHGGLPVLGFRLGGFTYITDANFISPEELRKVNGSRVLVLNALRRQKHISHFSLDEALRVAGLAGAGQVYFTHISHQMGFHDEVNSSLPPNTQLAHDGFSFLV